MAQTYSTELAGITSLPVVKASALQAYGARLKRFRASIVLASQAIGDTVVVGLIPAGYVFAGCEVSTDTSLGTATIALGTAALANKYANASTLTALNAQALIGNVAQLMAGPLTAQETVLLTVAVAALPAAGNLLVDLYFSSPN